MNDPVPAPDTNDAWLRREGARWRESRDGCPHPDVLAARESELLDPAMRDVLAAHVRRCAACAQFAADLEAVAADVPTDVVESRVFERVRREAAPAPRWQWTLPVAAAVLLACATGVVWWVRMPSGGAGGRGAMLGGADQPPPPQSQSTPSQPVEVAASWTIEAPPVRVPMSSLGPARSGETSASATLAEALAPYQEGRYDEAIPLLERAARLHPDSVDAAFYLGVARLLADHPADAIAPLERAAALALPGRRAEIAWYRATAEQRSGRTDAARARLDALCATASDFRARACAAAQALR